MGAASKLVALVVEDDGFQRRTVARMLRDLGATEVREARDGKEGLASMQGAPVDLVVCDLDMPEMDGMEFMRHLGIAHSSASVIISSAKDRSLAESVERMAIAYGVHLLGLLDKPATLAGLEDMIARRDATEPQLNLLTRADHSYNLQEILHGVRQKQFVPYYQPKVSLLTGNVLGMEALARWHHPEHGLVAPNAFISVLELAEDIDDLTLLILESAVRLCHRMHGRGFPLTVSLNLSLVSLTDTAMADRMSKIVHLTGLDPRFVIIEVTETAAMTEIAPALENLARLRMRGFGLSVDDFGTGFASLQQLMRVPFTELKIDRGFVTGSAAKVASRIILESSVGMARKFGISTVAEGVESVADWMVAKAAQCDMAQGFFIARPMEEELFMEFCVTNALVPRLPQLPPLASRKLPVV
jgi:EAL domain-containing protein (putative c-di-GMP-specific phosphodiesterase class I)/ActR/RegA family two-component response regulator